MDILEQKIRAYLKKRPNVDLKEIKRDLNIESEDGIKYLTDCLTKLQESGVLYEDKNGNFILMCDKPSIFQGRVHFLNNGDAYVSEKNIRVIIPKSGVSGILDRDIVTVNNLYTNKNNEVCGSIDKIIKRQNEQISCEVIFRNGINTLVPYNSKSNTTIRVNQRELDKHGVGEILLIELFNNRDTQDGQILKTIGHKNEPDVDEKAIAYDHGFEVEFSKKAIKELEKIPDKVDVEKALREKRKDLRHLNVFTIDGSDTKDIDDSIAIEKLSNGNYKLYVNIADVSYYVKEGTALDDEAYLRATSIYMNDTVIPMLPSKISNGICSLHPNVNRLAKTCEMIIDPNGKMLDYDIYDSIINSNKKMTYEDVNRILIDDEPVEGYEEFYDDLKTMNELSKKLNMAKKARGYIDFNRPDSKACGKGKNIHFLTRRQRDAENLIENFMLLANETIAKHVFFMGLPFLYRVHECPDEEKVDTFLTYLEELGFKFKRPKNITSNKFIQDITKMLEENDPEGVLSEQLLTNTMKKAKYLNINIKHFGLALSCYTHFTSPIRRYIDLMVHRLLNIYSKCNNLNVNELDEYLAEVANHCSERSREAEKADIEAHQMRVAEYMENNIGKTFDAIITSINKNGISVRLDEGIMAVVDLCDIGAGDYKRIDVKTISGSGKSYMIGDTISVTVKDASKKNKTIKLVSNKQRSKVKKYKGYHK